jgi:hypothetical protein
MKQAALDEEFLARTLICSEDFEMVDAEVERAAKPFAAEH